MASNNNPSSSSSYDRKTIERNRRIHMKFLFFKLNSLLPHNNQRSREGTTTIPDQLDEAAKYIKKLQINLEKMKEKKNSLMGIENFRTSNNEGMVMDGGRLNSPKIEIRQMGSALEVILITGLLLDYHFVFNEIIRLLHEDGVEIVNASFSVVDDKVFHIIHSKVEEDAQGQGYGAARISERLKKFCPWPNL